ncbi:MAG: ester cyclase [Nitrososphaeraceae archaeon]
MDPEVKNPVLPSEFTYGPEGVKKFASSVADSSHIYQVTHHDTIFNGDKVLIRCTFLGILKKEMLGMPPSDKPITIYLRTMKAAATNNIWIDLAKSQ